MNRREQFGGQSLKSPAVRYYSWASNEKAFRYYDKEKGENVTVFPLSVVYLTSRATIKGWNDATESAIYANEVKNTAKETLNVYSSKPDKKGNTLLATGIYKEIKGDIVSAGGHFEKVVWAYEKGVGVVKINLKGSGLQSYSNFEKENKNLFDNFISIDTFENGKKGATKYTFPVFKLGEKIDDVTDKLVEDAFKEVDAYLSQAKTSSNEQVEEYTNDEEDEGILEPVASDGLPF